MDDPRERLNVLLEPCKARDRPDRLLAIDTLFDVYDATITWNIRYLPEIIERAIVDQQIINSATVRDDRKDNLKADPKSQSHRTTIMDTIVVSRVHSFSTALPLELMQEIMGLYLDIADRGSVTNALLVHSSITVGLYRKLYSRVSVRTFRALLSLYWAFQNNPHLASYTIRLNFFPPITLGQRRSAILRSEGMASLETRGPWEIAPVMAVANSVRFLALGPAVLHADYIYLIRTTRFPSVEILRAPYSAVLNPSATTSLHSDMRSMQSSSLFHARPSLRNLRVENVVESWTGLVSLHIQLSVAEVLNPSLPSAKLHHLQHLQQLSISFSNSSAIYYVGYLEKFEMMKGLEVLLVIIDKEWRKHAPLKAPYPTSLYNYDRRLIFATGNRPYFRSGSGWIEGEEHLKELICNVREGKIWSRVWQDAKNMVEAKERKLNQNTAISYKF
ncbi:hypothetical protein VNI00_018665 [Paramarasmius palmivorus]|uniref:Uncharacterized protein n=1 Tax=Paramarasmius palmivorus TaxID=297713 RepID=A0AAW0AX19_9AGAR